MSITLENLDEYSQRFAKMLFEIHPEWWALATVESRTESNLGYLSIVVPSPSHPDSQLWITTDGTEVRIAFDYWHMHLGGWLGGEEREWFLEALENIEDILSEKTIIAVSMNGDQLCGSTNIKPGEIPKLIKGSRTYVRSWLGTYNAEYQH